MAPKGAKYGWHMIIGGPDIGFWIGAQELEAMSVLAVSNYLQKMTIYFVLCFTFCL